MFLYLSTCEMFNSRETEPVGSAAKCLRFVLEIPASELRGSLSLLTFQYCSLILEIQTALLKYTGTFPLS
jgi:hypothetical protein